MKKILILGAGVYQVPLIKKAKEMGIYTIVASIPGEYPGLKLADKVYYEDTTDYKKILEIAKNEKIDGILTAGTDVAVITIGYVCDQLGLKGISENAAQKATDKVLMKDSFSEYGVRTAKHRNIYFQMEKIEKELEGLEYPLMFKAVDTSGSRGIIKVNTEEEINDATQYVRSATKADYFVVEEFLEGEEFGAQSFVKDAKIEFMLPHGDDVFVGKTGVPIGHYAPYNLEPGIIEDMKVQLEGAIKAIGLDNCAINADFMLVNGKTYVIEIGGRSGATCLAELTSIYYNYNYYEKLIQVALGEEVDFSSDYAVPNASRLVVANESGQITDIDCISNDDNIVEIELDYKIGDTVNKFAVGTDRIGHVITKGETLEEAQLLLNETVKAVKIHVK